MGFGFSERGHKIEVANEDIRDEFLKLYINVSSLTCFNNSTIAIYVYNLKNLVRVSRQTRMQREYEKRSGHFTKIGIVFGKDMATGGFAIDIE